jgi:hypothetical protein
MGQRRDRTLVFFFGRITIDFKMFNSPFFGKSENGNQTQEFCRLKVVSTLSVSLRKKNLSNLHCTEV